MKLEEMSTERLGEEKRRIDRELARRHHLNYLLELNGKKTTEIIESLKKMWGENWPITMTIASNYTDLYSSDIIEKSNNLMQKLYKLRDERRDIIYKKLHEEE